MKAMFNVVNCGSKTQQKILTFTFSVKQQQFRVGNV